MTMFIWNHVVLAHAQMEMLQILAQGSMVPQMAMMNLVKQILGIVATLSILVIFLSVSAFCLTQFVFHILLIQYKIQFIKD